MMEWFWGECGSRSKSSGGLGAWRGGGVLGEENWEGEALVALGELGPWWRPLLPEVGKTTSSGRFAAMGRLGECTEAACERNVLGASLNRRSGSVPTVAADKVAGDRLTVLQSDVAVAG